MKKVFWVRNIVIGLAAVLWATGLAAVGQQKATGQFPVVADFRDPPLGADGDRIDSDGGGAYMDGQAKVSAVIQSGGANGDFVLNLSNTKGVRTLYIDFFDCITPGSCSTPFLADTVFSNTVVRTWQANLSSLPVGVPTLVRVHVSFWAPDPNQGGKNTGWFVHFDPLDQDTTCRSSYVTATRTSQNPDIWVIEAGAADEACLSALVGNTRQPRGKFHMPFQVTVRRK